ncbi:glycosyltransferase [Cohnella fermenti]|uniref:Glycosyltransferase family 4 protein n=1 Tax=Cohnella fermenti TaxID=2565925 RepID=A0A4S4BL60_9BACL|nr:glycosyltransferase [Cohnella fermenti]THF74896.1 glycosyltransferase family 4 protein [Cohnella fermenti]
MRSPYRIAIVHDYLNQMGGAERVVGLLHQMFPDAPIYTTILDRDRLWPELEKADIRASWMQRIPGILKRSKQFFWLYPFAVASMKLQGYDLVISSSSAFAKGVRVSGATRHICYCYTPMRFAWDFATYMESNEVTFAQRAIARLLMRPLRLWDRSNSRKVHRLVAISSIVQRRIAEYYGLSSELIFPPVNVNRFKLSDKPPEDYFLVVSRLVSYKRIDLAVEACTRARKKLIVIGDGPDRSRLESLAGPTVHFVGRLPDQEIERYMQHCLAFLFPGIEDFGITPLEVNACGRPVIAFRGGGALDTINPAVNGLFFDRQNVPDLIMALEEARTRTWNPAAIRRHAEQFGEQQFRHKMMQLVHSAMGLKEQEARTSVGLVAE